LKKITISIVDYGVGNHTSVIHSLRTSGFRVKVGVDKWIFEDSDVVLLPGVGGFPSAMQELIKLNLVDYLKLRAQKQQPIIGICLGMQLLTEESHEFQRTPGLGIIPGDVVPLRNPAWHIGWNTLNCMNDSPVFSNQRKTFYFNHSHIYEGPSKYKVCTTKHEVEFASVIRSGNTIGFQFHPEKSQVAGRELLHKTIVEVCSA